MINSVSNLNFADNWIDANAIGFIADALQSNLGLRVLIFDRNPLQAQGAKLLSDKLLLNYSLRHLSLNGTYLKSEGAIALFTALNGILQSSFGMVCLQLII